MTTSDNQGQESNRADTQYRQHLVTKVADNGQTLIRTSGAVLIAYIIYLTFSSFAGKESTATIELIGKLVTSLHVDQIIAYLTGLFGLGYGLLERKLRREYIEDFSGRIKKLEEWIDEGRSSSGLPPTGITRPED